MRTKTVRINDDDFTGIALKKLFVDGQNKSLCMFTQCAMLAVSCVFSARLLAAAGSQSGLMSVKPV